jgi:starch synthase
MKVAHILRKYNPAQWGGTETAIKRLLDGLTHHQVKTVVYSPKLEKEAQSDPLGAAGYPVKRFKAHVPVWGIPQEQKQRLVSVGGNLMSFDLLPALWKEDSLDLIHTHTHNRLGGIALSMAKIRKIPLAVTIHGGYLDLPPEVGAFLKEPLKGGFEWGKIFGILLRSRKVMDEADVVFTCNSTEASLLKKKYPSKQIVFQPHGVPADDYKKDCKAAALQAFPQVLGKKMLICVGRLDDVKNQRWVLEQFPEILRKHPDALLVFAGSVTDAGYGEAIKKRIEELGLGNKVLLTGGLPPGDPRLIGLFQLSEVVLLPSKSETFGLIIVEAWASGRTVISSRTSGAMEMIKPGENGWLFDLGKPNEFQEAVSAALDRPELNREYAKNGEGIVRERFDTNVLGGRVKKVYENVIENRKRHGRASK